MSTDTGVHNIWSTFIASCHRNDDALMTASQHDQNHAHNRLAITTAITTAILQMPVVNGTL